MAPREDDDDSGDGDEDPPPSGGGGAPLGGGLQLGDPREKAPNPLVDRPDVTDRMSRPAGAGPDTREVEPEQASPYADSSASTGPQRGSEGPLADNTPTQRVGSGRSPTGATLGTQARIESAQRAAMAEAMDDAESERAPDMELSGTRGPDARQVRIEAPDVRTAQQRKRDPASEQAHADQALSRAALLGTGTREGRQAQRRATPPKRPPALELRRGPGGAGSQGGPGPSAAPALHAVPVGPPGDQPTARAPRDAAQDDARAPSLSAPAVHVAEGSLPGAGAIGDAATTLASGSPPAPPGRSVFPGDVLRLSQAEGAGGTGTQRQALFVAASVAGTGARRTGGKLRRADGFNLLPDQPRGGGGSDPLVGELVQAHVEGQLHGARLLDNAARGRAAEGRIAQLSPLLQPLAYLQHAHSKAGDVVSPLAHASALDPVSQTILQVAHGEAQRELNSARRDSESVMTWRAESEQREAIAFHRLRKHRGEAAAERAMQDAERAAATALGSHRKARGAPREYSSAAAYRRLGRKRMRAIAKATEWYDAEAAHTIAARQRAAFVAQDASTFWMLAERDNRHRVITGAWRPGARRYALDSIEGTKSMLRTAASPGAKKVLREARRQIDRTRAAVRVLDAKIRRREASARRLGNGPSHTDQREALEAEIKTLRAARLEAEQQIEASRQVITTPKRLRKHLRDLRKAARKVKLSPQERRVLEAIASETLAAVAGGAHVPLEAVEQARKILGIDDPSPGKAHSKAPPKEEGGGPAKPGGETEDTPDPEPGVDSNVEDPCKGCACSPACTPPAKCVCKPHETPMDPRQERKRGEKPRVQGQARGVQTGIQGEEDEAFDKQDVPGHAQVSPEGTRRPWPEGGTSSVVEQGSEPPPPPPRRPPQIRTDPQARQRLVGPTYGDARDDPPRTPPPPLTPANSVVGRRDPCADEDHLQAVGAWSIRRW